MPTLDEFLQERGVRKENCIICDLPENYLTQVDAALGRGARYAVVEEWLIQEGQPGRRTALANHFKRGHADG